MRPGVRGWWEKAGLTALLILTAAGPARAHALGAECRLRGGRVEVEAYYDDDTPAGGATVRVLDEHKEEVASGRTDAQGRWTFPAPPPGQYAVVVDAGAGHRTTRTLTIPGGAAAGTVSDGPPRAEFTRFPWGGLGIGLGLIAGAVLLLRALARRKGLRRDPSTPAAR